MVINIQDDILRLNAMGLLTRLLQDKATKGSILWATNAYCQMGDGYEPGNKILPQRITGENSDLIKTRARRAMEQRTQRTRQHAEVFTPRWVVSKMNDFCDRQWFGRKDGIYKTTDDGKIYFSKHKHWKLYVDAKRMEITCGEAPFLCSRYDVETGEAIPVEERIGLLDRKLRVVSQQAQDRDEWQLWAMRAVQSVYGYELQGDNLLIARVNILCTVEEHLYARWREKPEKGWLEKLCNVIAWNLWQMDGLNGCVPVPPLSTEEQLSLFPSPQIEMNLSGETEQERIPCRLYDWRGAKSISYKTLREEGKKVMKFDFIIGNPPYQDENVGSNNQAKPIYNLFMENAYGIGDKVELITPARFLTQAGATPKEWNKKMLNSRHFKILHYIEDSSFAFSGVDIKGGVVVSYYDSMNEYAPIGVFIKNDLMRSVFGRINPYLSHNVGELVHSPDSYRFTDAMFAENPTVIGRTDKQHAKAVASSVFDRYPEIFWEEKSNGDAEIVGRKNGERKKLCTRICYLNDPGNLYKWKVLIAGAIGSGAFGETISEPIVMGPESAHTQTFVSMGEFESRYEAESLSKYLKTKLARALLGIMKTTQNNQSKVVWSKIPLQDFTPASDIDWSKSIPEIDRQLYAKYGLDEDEIAFIESHVKEMS